MSKRRKRSPRKQGRVDDVDSEYRGPRNRRDYDLGPREEYSYSAYEDRRNDWRDLYRSPYRRDYDMYEDSSRYTSGRYYDDYDPYHDDYDYGHPGCRACESNRRGGGMYDDYQYLYRYEEDPPGMRYGSDYRDSGRGYRDSGRSYRDSGRSYRDSGRDNRDSGRRHRERRESVPRETEKTMDETDVSVYAVPDVSGQKGFKYKKYNDQERRRRSSESYSETETDSQDYREHKKRTKKKKRRAE